jgi:hypothetical protein
MRDKTRITIGLGLFLLVGALPLWNALSDRGEATRPILERPANETNCVEDTLYMAGHHQDLLNEWRTAVVRSGERYYTSRSGVRYEMSLTGTCMKCHTNSQTFCERCHRYADVQITCWNCHVAPEEPDR